MTQTIDQRARELLAKQVEADWQSGAEAIRSNQITAAKFGSDTYPWIMCAISALTEALTRIEELEGALRQKRDMLNLARQLLGSKGAELVTRLIDGGAMGFHASWGEEAHTLTGEQRADVLLQFMDAPSTPLEFNDAHDATLQGIKE